MQRVEVYLGYWYSGVATDAQALQMAHVHFVVDLLRIARPRSGQNGTG